MTESCEKQISPVVLASTIREPHPVSVLLQVLLPILAEPQHDTSVLY